MMRSTKNNHDGLTAPYTQERDLRDGNGSGIRGFLLIGRKVRGRTFC